MIESVAGDAESWSNVAANAAQVLAIIVGGWWAYTRFIRQRERFPRATLELDVSHRELDRARTFLRVTLSVDNVSTVLLATEEIRTDVYRVVPVTAEVESALRENALVPDGASEADWPCLESRQIETSGEIEPGESDQFGFDFIVPTDTATILIYSYIRNPTKNDLGWAVTALYDLDTSSGHQRERAEARPARRQR